MSCLARGIITFQRAGGALRAFYGLCVKSLTRAPCPELKSGTGETLPTPCRKFQAPSLKFAGPQKGGQISSPPLPSLPLPFPIPRNREQEKSFSYLLDRMDTMDRIARLCELCPFSPFCPQEMRLKIFRRAVPGANRKRLGVNRPRLFVRSLFVALF